MHSQGCTLRRGDESRPNKTLHLTAGCTTGFSWFTVASAPAAGELGVRPIPIHSETVMRYSQQVLVVILLGVVAVALAPARADEKEDRAKDEAAIKQLGKDWQDAWNKKDADGLAALLSKDVDFI